MRRVLLHDNHATVRRSRYGFRIEVDAWEFIGEMIFSTGSFDLSTTEALRALVEPNDVVFDVGANIGWMTCAAAQVLSGGLCVAFEPLPSCAERLKRNLALNGFRNVAVETAALCGPSHPRLVTLYESPSRNQGNGSLYRSAATQYPAEQAPVGVLVSSTSLDEYVDQTHRVPSVVKIDVEGAELAVLQGGANLFRSSRAPVLLIEFNHRALEAAGTSAEALFQHLVDLDYMVYMIDGMRHLRRLVTPPSHFGDCVCVRAEQMGRLAAFGSL